jgi:hypothetical protein
MKGERQLFPPEQLVSDETRAKWRQRIDFIAENGDGTLSEWEEGFVQDIERRIASGKDLTLAQSAKLNEVFHKVEEAVG